MDERKEKFTPGPWKIVGEHTKHRKIVKIYHRRKVDVGNETEIAFVDILDPSIVENGIANAVLIAAAPDMYDALKSECVACQLRDHETYCEDCRIERVLKKARGEK